MGKHNDSINQKITPAMHAAMNRITFAIMDILKDTGLTMDFPIDRNSATGEVIMSKKTCKGIQAFAQELKKHKITVDKIGFNQKAEGTGYYVMQGREISPGGVVLSEGKCLGFVQAEMVDGEVTYKGGTETAAGVMV